MSTAEWYANPAELEPVSQRGCIVSFSNINPCSKLCFHCATGPNPTFWQTCWVVFKVQHDEKYSSFETSPCVHQTTKKWRNRISQFDSWPCPRLAVQIIMDVIKITAGTLALVFVLYIKEMTTSWSRGCIRCKWIPNTYWNHFWTWCFTQTSINERIPKIL